MEQPTFISANPLEEALVRAATDSSMRPAFYRQLLEAEIFFLTPEAPRTLETQTNVSFVHWRGKDGDYLPAFSSLEQLQEVVNKSGVTYGYIGLKGQVAFKILAQRPMEILLNPGCSFGKQFLPAEIQQIADGSLFTENERVLEKVTKILLGQPKDYPHKMVAVLSDLFAQHPSVTAAHLAQMHDPSSGEPPHILIGLETSKNCRQVIADAGIAIRDVIGEGKFVDFIQLGSGDASFDNYFQKQAQPFYTKQAQKKSRWKFW
jgi:SseB protein C-terminal domain/SseB protein N-terminal domain